MPFLLPFIFQSSAIPNTFTSNTPTSQQSWSLLSLCYTIHHAKTYLLSSRSWSLSAKQDGSWPASTSSSSKGGCATTAICGWNSWSKWDLLCTGSGQLFSRDRQLEEPPGDSQIPVRFRPLYLPIPLSPRPAHSITCLHNFSDLLPQDPCSFFCMLCFPCLHLFSQEMFTGAHCDRSSVGYYGERLEVESNIHSTFTVLWGK